MSLEGAGSNDFSRVKYTTDRLHVKPFLTKFPHLSKPPAISPQHGDDIFSGCAAINPRVSPRSGKPITIPALLPSDGGPRPILGLLKTTHPLMSSKMLLIIDTAVPMCEVRMIGT